MSHKELTDALDAVQRQLQDSAQLDAEDVKHLESTIQDIQSSLDQQSTQQPQSAQSSDQQPESLRDRILVSAKRFEESHPKLTETLGLVADILQQMGI